jgi:hypothetical protein
MQTVVNIATGESPSAIPNDRKHNDTTPQSYKHRDKAAGSNVGDIAITADRPVIVSGSMESHAEGLGCG